MAGISTIPRSHYVPEVLKILEEMVTIYVRLLTGEVTARQTRENKEL